MTDLADVAAVLDAQAAAIRAAAAAVEAAAEQLRQPSPPPPPPPPPVGVLYPRTVSATSAETSITVQWEPPDGSPRTLVAWGDRDGFISQAFVGAGVGTCLIRRLQPGTEHTVDVLAAQADGTFDSVPAPGGGRVRVVTTTLPGDVAPDPDPPPDPVPGDYPADPTAWDQKRDWTLAQAGPPTSGLTVIDSAASLAAAGLPGTWANGQWALNASGTYDGLDVRGLVYYTGQGALRLLNGRSHGVAYSATAGKQGGRFERWEFGPSPAGRALGQGALNFWGQTGWTVSRCVLHGFADGIQCSGSGLVEESVIHQLAYGPATHNDWIQHYGGGTVRCVRSIFYSDPPQANHHNGVFSSNSATANYELVDCDLRVTGPHAALSNILHANTGTITLTRCRARGGRLIRDVRYSPDSLVSGNPDAAAVRSLGRMAETPVEILRPFAEDGIIYVPRYSTPPDFALEIAADAPRRYDAIVEGDAHYQAAVSAAEEAEQTRSSSALREASD